MQEKVLPLTLLQRLIVQLSLLDRRAPVANISMALELEGINAEKLQDSLQVILSLHPSFRLRFSPTETGVQQTLASQMAFEWGVVDMKSSEPEEATIRKDLMVREMSEQVIDVFAPRLFKINLIELPEEKLTLVIVAHHGIIDGHSMALLAYQISNHYHHGVLPEPGQSDVQGLVDRELRYLGSSRFVRDREYWLNQLAEPYQYLAFKPGDDYRNRSNFMKLRIQRTAIDQWQRQLDSDSIHLSTAFTALWWCFLHREFKPANDAIRLGMPVHGRTLADKEEVSFKGNLLIHNLALVNPDNFNGLCAQIKRQLRASYRHQKFPPELLYEPLNLTPEDLLCEFRFNYLEGAAPDDPGTAKTNCSYESHNHHRTPLMLSVVNYLGSEQVELLFEYNLSCFDDAKMQAMVQQFTQLLQQNAPMAAQNISLLKPHSTPLCREDD